MAASRAASASGDATAGSDVATGVDIDAPNAWALACSEGSMGAPAWFAAHDPLEVARHGSSIPISPPRSRVETPAMNWLWRTSTRRSGSAARVWSRPISSSAVVMPCEGRAGRSEPGGGTTLRRSRWSRKSSRGVTVSLQSSPARLIHRARGRPSRKTASKSSNAFCREAEHALRAPAARPTGRRTPKRTPGCRRRRCGRDRRTFPRARVIEPDRAGRSRRRRASSAGSAVLRSSTDSAPATARVNHPDPPNPSRRRTTLGR
jgi:hypothetical protein